jgi:predicted MFS family arabinose efflux permease
VGHWTDRRGAREPLRLGLLFSAALLAVVPFVPGRGWIFGYMLALGSTCSLLMSPCGPAVAGHVEGKGGSDFGSVFSLLNIAFSLGLMAGPMLGSTLTDQVGLAPAMAVLAAGFVLYLAPLAQLGRSA